MQNHRMRIAVDARALQGSATGVGRYLEGLLAAWLDLFPGDSFLLLGSRMLRLPAGLAGRVETLAPPFPLPGGPWLQSVAPLAAVRKRCDLFFAPLGIVPLAAPMPCLVTVHDLTPLLFPEWHHARNRLGFVPLLAASLRKAAAIAAVSEATRLDILDSFPEAGARCVVVPNGVTVPAAATADRHER